MLTFHEILLHFYYQATFQMLNLVYVEIIVTFRAFDTSLLFSISFSEIPCTDLEMELWIAGQIDFIYPDLCHEITL